MFQFTGVMEGVRQGGIDAAEHNATQGHSQNESVAEPATALALHGEYVAGVELRQQTHHNPQGDQINQVDRQEAHKRGVLPFQLEAQGAVETSSAHHVGPGVGGEGGDQHQQQHHGPG